MAAGLPGKRSTFGSVRVVCGQTVLEGAIMKTNGSGSKKLSRNIMSFSVLLVALLVSAWARAEQVTLAWDANTEADLAGYKIHYGTASGSYTTSVDVHKVTTSSIVSLTAGQTYYFAVTAYNAANNESGYSNQVSYSIPAPNGVPLTPATPSGASAALVNASIAFSTSTTDPNGDSLEYRYDWGAGVLSNWGASSQSCSWPTAGTYVVKAQARDSHFAESAWSVGKTVTISQNQPPTAPATPTGGSSALVNTAITFSTSATDPNGDSLQYRYDWGSGVLSSWGASSQSCSWAAAGQYAVKAQARDTSLFAESAWSSVKTVTISNPAPVDPDSDGDGVPDSLDAFPNDPKEWLDSNHDGTGDNAEAAAAAAAAAAKQAPEAPLLVAPINNAVVSTMAILKTGAFHTAVTGTTHAKSRWQIFRDEDNVCVLDIQSTIALTSLTVPKLVLDEGTPYFWQVQFIDSKGAASAWSDYEDFITSKTNADLNANGIPDVQEVGSMVDLDHDGVRDNRQPRYIKSVKMEGTSVQIGVSIKGCSTCLGVESVESEDVRQLDSYAYGKPASMPFALINFKIAVAKPGDTAVVKLYFSKAASYSSKWYKYDPIADRWYDFSAYAKFAGDRKSVTLTLKDGGPGDADGVANGVIVDPAGVAEVDDEIVSTGGSGASVRVGGPIASSGATSSPLGLLGMVSLGALGALRAYVAMLAAGPCPSQQRRNCIEVVS
jgi:hypothetical protein